MRSVSDYTLFIYIFPIEKTIRSASKGRQPDRNPYHPYTVVSEIHLQQSINEKKTPICL
jgi:hypothetical protein